MKCKYRFLFQTIIYVIISFFAGIDLSAQCNNIQLQLTPTHSTCQANGAIQVTLTGSDVGNIRQTDMEFEIKRLNDGMVIPSTCYYPLNTISNLGPGQYEVSLSAFCTVSNGWMVASHKATVTITSSYNILQAVMGTTPRKSLNCVRSGSASIAISAGSAPYTVTITSAPVSYPSNAQKVFTRSSAGTLVIDSLSAGNYTFEVSDACAYTRTLTTTIGALSADYAANMIYENVFPPVSPLQFTCNTISFSRNYSPSGTDEYYYFYTYFNTYYELGIQVNGTGPIDWISTAGTRFNYPLPYGLSLNDFRSSPNINFFRTYVRIKGTSCQFQIRDVIVKNTAYPSSSTVINCSNFSITHTPYDDYDGVYCYPYKWRVITVNNLSPYDTIPTPTPWSNWIYNRDPQTATGIDYPPSGYTTKLQFEDSNGYIWTRNLSVTRPSASISNASSPCSTPLPSITNGYFDTYIYIYPPSNYSTYFPQGTQIEFVSGPSTPPHTNVTVSASNVRYFLPFTSGTAAFETGSSFVSHFRDIAPGTYTFRVTYPGGTCPSISISTTVSRYKVKDPIAYTTRETCGSLIVKFTGGQYVYQNALNGPDINYPTYFYILSAAGVSVYDQRKVQVGDSLVLYASGKYVLAMSYSSTSNCVLDTDTINYTITPFSLNELETSAYLCQGSGGIGFIRAKGQGGSGNFEYELIDPETNTVVGRNATGVFNYGAAGKSYTIILHDIDPSCQASFPQTVYMRNLTTAQIAFTNNPNDRCCLSDSIYLRCLTLGQTTYEWQNVNNPGVGITPANEHDQNPIIAAKDLGPGSHTFMVTVTPEGCGTPMQQSVTVTIEDCSGAHDDHLTLFVNTKDTVDVLANDAFPLSCAGSVAPVVTVGPTQGTYQIVDKQVVYTPNLDFVGRDSMTYSATCGTTTTYAKIYFNVLEMPDNIIEADCFDDPPEINWDIQKLMESPAIDVVNYYSMPFVGDVDNDGKTEIFAPGASITGQTIFSNVMYVFEVDGNTITRQQKIDIPFINLVNNPYSIANVDGGPYAALFIATTITSNSSVDQGQLIKYVYNGTQYVESWKRTYTTLNTRQSPQPMIADFNNDGIPEVLVYDKIFNAGTGDLLVDAGYLSDATKGFGFGGHAVSGIGGWSPAVPHAYASMMAVADVDGDGCPEVIGGNCVYQIQITNPNGTAGNSFTLLRQASTIGRTDIRDGATAIADMDGDGLLDVVVTAPVSNTTVSLYIWNPRTGDILNTNVINNLTTYSTSGASVPFIGDIDGDNAPEICIITLNMMRAFEYDATTRLLSQKWNRSVSDGSGATTMSLFDFNQDGQQELVYRDESALRIINGSTGVDKPNSTFTCYSSTGNEYPVVADINNDGAAEIIVTGSSSNSTSTGKVMVFAAKTAKDKWAPARKVWNQFSYNAVNVKENLTIPKTQLNPASFFPNGKQPFNGYLMQQTMLDIKGDPIFLMPDVYTDFSIVNCNLFGDSVCIKVGLVNRGDAAIGSPVYVSVYKETSPMVYDNTNRIRNDSATISIMPGDTGYVFVRIPDITPFLPMGNIIIRLNDKNGVFTYQAECDSSNNMLAIVNPVYDRLMRKNATLMLSPLPLSHNGTYPNPVAILYKEEIEYRLSLVNKFVTSETIEIRDTLPAYLNYLSASITPATPPTTTGTPPRYVLAWIFPGVAPNDSAVVTFLATPQAGVSASQPMFINQAQMTIHGYSSYTNNTYHQGAGITLVTFSAGYGGRIYNASEQALDYGTSPYSGVVVVPDEGFRFAGWSHPAYRSLRGGTIPAQSGVQYYETLTVYGDVTLRADFEPEPVIDVSSLGEIEKAILNPPADKTDRIWAAAGELYVRTSHSGSIVRIYSMEGILLKMQTILQPGVTKIQLPAGLYVVTLNNSLGTRIMIND